MVPLARRWVSSGLHRVRMTGTRGRWRARGLVLRSGTVHSNCPGLRCSGLGQRAFKEAYDFGGQAAGQHGA